MNVITIVLILGSFSGLTYEFALAPATVGGIASSAGRLSNTIKVCLHFTIYFVGLYFISIELDLMSI